MITDLSVHEINLALRSKELSAEQVIITYLSQLERTNETFKAFTEVFTDESIETARQIDKKIQMGDPVPPLAGVPVAIKDNICTVDGKTTCASKMLADFHSPYEATVIQRLKEGGAVLIGKTNMDEFAMGSSTETSHYGYTYNPWDTGFVPGGSSGGSAAAVSARQCLVALGSDTGGSIRQPASFCGIVGLKPTYGMVSRYGLIAYGSSLDQIGPLARDVTDCAVLAQTIGGYDPLDSTSTNRPVDDLTVSLDQQLSDLTIGLPIEFFSDVLNPEVEKCLSRAVRIYRDCGAKIKEVHLPHSRIDMDESGSVSSYAVACYYIIAMAEASSNLSRYDGIHYGHRSNRKPGDVVDLYAKSRSEGFGEEVKRRILLGAYTLSSGYYDAYYLKALKVRKLITEDFDKAFESCQILLCPVTPYTAFRFGEKTTDPLDMYLEDIYTLSANLAGIPSLSLPCGLGTNGLPIGMQLVGPPFSEMVLLRAGRMFEKQSGFFNLDPRNKDLTVKKNGLYEDETGGRDV